MATTTMRLGLILVLALVIIQISKAQSETEDQNELDQESEASMMASSSEEEQIRTVREAGKKGNKLNRNEKNAQKKKQKKKGGKARRKSGRRKNNVGRRQRKGKAGKVGKKPKNGNGRKRPRKGKKRNNNKRKSGKKLKRKEKKNLKNKNGNRSGKKTNKQKIPKPPTGVARQGTCDEKKLCQKIKDYIKYSNQLRKVKRIVKSCDTMDKKATKAATEFSATVAALDQVISGNAKRQLYIRWRRTKRSTDEVVAIRDNLKNCSASAKAKCEKSVEPACGETAIHTECEAALQAWVTSFGPSKGSCLQASAECCACITALPEVDAKCLDFDAKSTAAVASKKKCVGSSETGSFGFCRKQQQDASVKGPKAACGGSTATKAPGAGTTKAATAANTAAQGGTTASVSSTSCTCGKKSTRILGGADANKMEYPWMVSLVGFSGGVEQGHFCGGSVINSRWVQTASHCISTNGGIPASTLKPLTSFKVRIGDHNIASTTDSDKAKDLEVEEIHVHKNSSGQASLVDLALLKVKTAIDLTVYTPLCMPASGFEIRGKKVTLAGWGIKSCANPATNIDCDNPAPTEATILQELVNMTVPDAATCNAAHKGIPGYDSLSQKIFCFGGIEGKSSCFGDSGSGLIYNDNGKYTLVGSVSAGTGNGCGEAGAYGVSNTVADYRAWYDATATGGTTCS